MQVGHIFTPSQANVGADLSCPPPIYRQTSIGADKSAVGAINRPLQTIHTLMLYRPAKFPLRFSALAASPSLASSLWKQSCWSSRSSAKPSDSATSAPDCTERLMRPTVLDALLGGQNWWAYSITLSQ